MSATDLKALLQTAIVTPPAASMGTTGHATPVEVMRARGLPADVGILAMEIYFPKTCVKQTDLEKHDGVSEGKYTIGLGQERMAYCGDREDINSMSLTVVQNLVERFGVDLATVGRLEVGTETIIDKSKSVKSALMMLFATAGNHDVEGVDTTNACYGGTAALLNSLNWIESSAWDGRTALVVAGDIALYANGNARPTGGAGAVAMLIGPNAPLVFDRGVRSTFMDHAYDFYKPQLDSEYPVVDGQLSVTCYLNALNRCFDGYKEKMRKRIGADIGLDAFKYCCFHAPYNKLVQKSWARLLYNEFRANPGSARFAGAAGEAAAPFADLDDKEANSSADMIRAFTKLGKQEYAEKIVPTTLLPINIGNMYTASLYSGLASLLVSRREEELVGARVMMFSYGSGLAASMFSLVVKGPVAPITGALRSFVDRLHERPDSRPEDFVAACQLREDTHMTFPYQPVSPVEQLYPGTYYIDSIDDKYRRKYARVAPAPLSV